MKLKVIEEFTDGNVIAEEKNTKMMYVGQKDEEGELVFAPVLSYSVATHDDGRRELVAADTLPDYLLLGDKPETLA